MALTLYRIDGCGLNDPDIVQKAFANNAQVKELTLKGALQARLFYITGAPRRPRWADYVEQIAAAALPTGTRTNDGAILLVSTSKSAAYVYAVTWGSSQRSHPHRPGPACGAQSTGREIRLELGP